MLKNGRLTGEKRMDVQVVLRIAALGILLAVVEQVLKRMGREDIATLCSLSGVILVLLLVVQAIANLFSQVQSAFGLL